MPFDYMRLVWFTAAGFVAFGEIPDRWTLAGGAVIAGSSLYLLLREHALAPKETGINPRFSSGGGASLASRFSFQVVSVAYATFGRLGVQRSAAVTIDLEQRSDINLASYERVAWQGEAVELTPAAKEKITRSRAAFLDFIKANPDTRVYGSNTRVGPRRGVGSRG